MPIGKGITHAQCPYFVCEGDCNIVCEGYEGKTRSVKVFKSIADKREHQQKYCFDLNRYQDCSQCILNDVKYKLIERGLKDCDGES